MNTLNSINKSLFTQYSKIILNRVLFKQNFLYDGKFKKVSFSTVNNSNIEDNNQQNDSKQSNNIKENTINSKKNIQADEEYLNSQTYTRDDKFWAEYKKKMSNRKLLSPLKSQTYITNDTIHSWEYAKRHSILASELYEELHNITVDTKEENIPFVVLDVREENEYEIFDFPLRNKNKGMLPIIKKTPDEINRSSFHNIPNNKYIVIIDSVGLRSRGFSHVLINEGYLALYVEGGIDLLSHTIKLKGRL